MANEEKVVNAKVETFASDMAQAIDGSEGGSIKKIIEEQEKEEDEKDKASPERKTNQILMIVGIILTVCALGAVVFLMLYKKVISTVPIQAQFTPMIYLEATGFEEISDLTKDQIFQLINNDVAKEEIKPDGIMGIYVTANKQVLGLRKFLTLIGANIDQTKMEFVSDNFLIGATNIDSKNMFILIKMRSFSDIFDPMRGWEEKMFFDLHGFFGLDINADTKYLLTKNFENGIIQNKNARILRDKDGKIVMMYVFADDTSMIITNNEASVHEIMTRLSSSTVRK